MRSAHRVLLLCSLALSCGAPKAGNRSGAGAGGGALKMLHQIMFEHGDDVQVFDGYMILSGDAFVVKAFAGPGVDLFTVVRSGNRTRNTLHIESLADRIDIERVGADIARVYLDGCGSHGEESAKAGELECDCRGEPLVETRGEDGRLLTRRFPSAHGVGLTVTYSEHARMEGRLLPRRITLQWGSSANKMTILLVEADASVEFPYSEVEAALAP